METDGQDRTERLRETDRLTEKERDRKRERRTENNTKTLVIFGYQVEQ